ncbi:hypothetical protein LPJ56_003350 [Coemansia sp. RSA 2599]|nr:hypothetical protein LPJ75_003120 [Coemansia sp. RSA 2598]KAJ1820852.1 hypothetical protein LPJ56_003350 [Coemansia sp. RSA 2599]
MPKNAIYDILLDGKVQGIPQLFSHGLLIEDFWGYRLEYIVMEDCGVPLSKALETLRPRGEKAFVIYLKQIIDEVTACLVDASVAGVLHRDISDSNIAVQTAAGHVFIALLKSKASGTEVQLSEATFNDSPTKRFRRDASDHIAADTQSLPAGQKKRKTAER